ncbi:MAG: helix-turn-helix transcriptional regulator [Clostridiales bacterium]|nr:helix-turn-helix transcriptional regulator [Clostridiales bacterium]
MKIVLRQERERRNWTQEYVALKIGISQTALHKIENGQRYPSYKVLVKLLDLFGYNDPRRLFTEAGDTSNLSDEL